MKKTKFEVVKTGKVSRKALRQLVGTTLTGTYESARSMLRKNIRTTFDAGTRTVQGENIWYNPSISAYGLGLRKVA